MFDHQDALDALNRNIPISDKLSFLHAFLRQKFDFIDRIAIALHEVKSDTLKTFVYSNSNNEPTLVRYESKLSSAASLLEILEKRRPRVVNDLDIFSAGPKLHTQRIQASGFGASYTMPMYSNGNFFGFLFFNSYRNNVFTEQALHYLDLFCHLLSLTVISEISSIHTLLASVKTANDIVHHRDFETGTHLDRMANYSRLIAKQVAEKYRLDDELIEHIFLFSPAARHRQDQRGRQHPAQAGQTRPGTVRSDEETHHQGARDHRRNPVQLRPGEHGARGHAAQYRVIPPRGSQWQRLPRGAERA